MQTAQDIQATELDHEIDRYLEEHWDEMLDDLRTLVRIPSVENTAEADPERAPWGPESRQALSAVLDMARAAGGQVTDCEGRIGFADWPGTEDVQLGIIGHVDVVPAGPGWTVDPWDVTEREGYLLGRGVIDDKGPVLMALHAVRFWHERNARTGEQFPYTIRFLFGAQEETGMGDVAYYRERYADPDFLFTPDAAFPVCNGEKGVFQGRLTSGPIAAGNILELSGGVATNAVPGVAYAMVDAAGASLDAAAGIELEQMEDGRVRISAQGRSAHASTPELGVSAIQILLSYLLEHDLCSDDERAVLEPIAALCSHTDGAGADLACEDEFFGPLTMTCGKIDLEEGRIMQSVDMRYPTCITADELTAGMNKVAEEIGGSFTPLHNMDPFLVDADHPAIQALLAAYNTITGENAEPFTMGGASYAREFTVGASFGVEKPWQTDPEWVGGMHGPDEGVRVDQLQEAFKIYAHTLPLLMQVPLK